MNPASIGNFDAVTIPHSSRGSTDANRSSFSLLFLATTYSDMMSSVETSQTAFPNDVYRYLATCRPVNRRSGCAADVRATRSHLAAARGDDERSHRASATKTSAEFGPRSNGGIERDPSVLEAQPGIGCRAMNTGGQPFGNRLTWQ